MALGKSTRAAHRHRRNARAFRERETATRMKRAAARWIDRIGKNNPELRVRNAAAGFGREHRFEQCTGIGMLRALKQAAGILLFHDPAEIHDGDTGREVLDYRKIVADEDVGD